VKVKLLVFAKMKLSEYIKSKVLVDPKNSALSAYKINKQITPHCFVFPKNPHTWALGNGGLLNSGSITNSDSGLIKITENESVRHARL